MSETGPDRAYREFLEQGRFMIQRARASGRYVFYPRIAEPNLAAAFVTTARARLVNRSNMPAPFVCAAPRLSGRACGRRASCARPAD